VASSIFTLLWRPDGAADAVGQDRHALFTVSANS
jgi:hypothetical protein